MGVFNRNGEDLGRNKCPVGGRGCSKSPVLANFHLRYILDIHENMKLESPLRFRFRSNWQVEGIEYQGSHENTYQECVARKERMAKD